MKIETGSQTMIGKGRPSHFGWANILLAAALSGFPGISSGQPQQPAKPSPQDKCPVCGMFVAGYQDFLAAVTFKDGAALYFDGCKDMFRFLFNTEKYAPGRKRSDVAAVWVTDYYSLKLTDGFAARYILGSDVLGPMGRELIPFAKEEEARQFTKDHKGESLLRFEEVTPDVVGNID
jgi:nitrous oxide reductase accessory protein NosL